MNPQEYLTISINALADMIDRDIGVDYEINREEYLNGAGSITVFELEQEEHKQIRDFLDRHELWGKE